MPTSTAPRTASGKPFSGRMQDDVRTALLNIQTECTFIWGKQDGSGAGTIMSCLWHDNSLWLTTNDGLPRIRAVERIGKAAAVITGTGTTVGHTRCISLHGTCLVHRAAAIPVWFYPAFSAHLFPNNTHAADKLRGALDRPGQVVLQLIPDTAQCYDGQVLMQRMAETTSA